MRYLTPLFALVCGLFIIGCQQQEPEPIEYTPTEKLLSVEEPHSMLMTSTGRLFIDSKQGKIYEVTKTDNDYQLVQFNSGQCTNAFGIAEKNGWLFSVCVYRNTYNFALGQFFGTQGPGFRYSSSRLIAHPLNGQHDSTTFTDIGKLTDFTNTQSIAAMTTKDELVIGQYCPFCLSRVGKVELDFSGDIPAIKNQAPIWAGYFGKNTTIFQRMTQFEEITIVKDKVYIADSTVLRIDENAQDGSNQIS